MTNGYLLGFLVSFLSLFSFSSQALNTLVPQLRLSNLQWEYKTGSNLENRTITIPVRKNDGSPVPVLHPTILNQVKSQLKFRVCLGTASPDQSSTCHQHSMLRVNPNFDLYYVDGKLMAAVVLEQVNDTDLFYINMSSYDNGSEAFLSATKTISYRFIGDLEMLRSRLFFYQHPPSGYEIAGGGLGTLIFGTENVGAGCLARAKPHLYAKVCDGSWNCSQSCDIGSSWGVACPLTNANYGRGIFLLLNIGPLSENVQNDGWSGVQYQNWEITHSPLLEIPAAQVVQAQPDVATVAGGVHLDPNIINNLDNAGNTIANQLGDQADNLSGVFATNGGQAGAPEAHAGDEAGNSEPDNPIPPPDVGENVPHPDPGEPVGGWGAPLPEPAPQPGTGQEPSDGAPAGGGSSGGCSLQTPISSGNAMSFLLVVFPLFLGLCVLRRSKQPF